MTTEEIPIPTILCVDDDVNLLSAIRRLLRNAGYRVLIAENGEEGLAEIEAVKGAVDLVISDMQMPAMDGASFLIAVRLRWAHIARILLADSIDAPTATQVINDAEIHGFFSKPWNDENLLHGVKQVLAKWANVGANPSVNVAAAVDTQQNESLKKSHSDLEAKLAGSAEELRLTQEKLKKSFFSTIQTLSNLMNLRGGNIAEHSKRVAELARKIARQMQLDNKTCNDIFLAGLLHDIGKIAFPDGLIGKLPSKLTPGERGVFCAHPLKGEQVVMALGEMSSCAILIRHHHENFDGTGYPSKLSGAAIPLGARILAVANDYDGMLNRLLIERSLSETDVRLFIENGKGSRYDPVVVDAFLGTTKREVEVEAEAEKEVVKETAMTYLKLRPDMRLSRELRNKDGQLLLAAGFVLDEALISQIADYARQDGGRMQIYIQTDTAL